MKKILSRSFGSVKEQSYILILLFIYRLLWGYFLYRFIRSGVLPLLLHYPEQRAGGSGMGRLLYYLEGQFALTSDPGVHRYLWTLLALCLLRLLLSPFIRAGILNELHQERMGERGLFFFPGMKRFGLPVFLFSVAEWVLAVLPLPLLLPRITRYMLGGIWDYHLLLNAVPYILAWLAYLYLIRLALLYMQFGYIAGTGMFPALLICLRTLLSAVALSATLGAAGLAALLLYATGAGLWPGFPALLLRQVLPLPQTLFKMWGIAAQYHLWSSKAFSE